MTIGQPKLANSDLTSQVWKQQWNQLIKGTRYVWNIFNWPPFVHFVGSLNRRFECSQWTSYIMRNLTKVTTTASCSSATHLAKNLQVKGCVKLQPLLLTKQYTCNPINFRFFLVAVLTCFCWGAYLCEVAATALPSNTAYLSLFW